MPPTRQRPLGGLDRAPGLLRPHSRHLGHLIGAFTVDIGDLSSIVQLWGYDDLNQRAERRARMQADPRWQSFLERLTPMIHTQRNRILVPTAFSPLR